MSGEKRSIDQVSDATSDPPAKRQRLEDIHPEVTFTEEQYDRYIAMLRRGLISGDIINMMKKLPKETIQSIDGWVVAQKDPPKSRWAQLLKDNVGDMLDAFLEYPTLRKDDESKVWLKNNTVVHISEADVDLVFDEVTTWFNTRRTEACDKIVAELFDPTNEKTLERFRNNASFYRTTEGNEFIRKVFLAFYTCKTKIKSSKNIGMPDPIAAFIRDRLVFASTFPNKTEARSHIGQMTAVEKYFALNPLQAAGEAPDEPNPASKTLTAPKRGQKPKAVPPIQVDEGSGANELAEPVEPCNDSAYRNNTPEKGVTSYAHQQRPTNEALQSNNNNNNTPPSDGTVRVRSRTRTTTSFAVGK